MLVRDFKPIHPVEKASRVRQRRSCRNTRTLLKTEALRPSEFPVNSSRIEKIRLPFELVDTLLGPKLQPPATASAGWACLIRGQVHPPHQNRAQRENEKDSYGCIEEEHNLKNQCARGGKRAQFGFTARNCLQYG
jgi:hypothetical protein